MTPEEFLAWEAEQPTKYEYSRSGIFAMAGASRPHVTITPNLTIAIGVQLKGGSCRFQDADTKLWVHAERAYYYPDGMVACPPNFLESPQGAIDNPTVIFEVLSPSTHDRDLGEKMVAYLTIPTLREFVVILSNSPAVTVYERRGEEWMTRVTVGTDATTTLALSGLTLPHADLYEGLEFDRVQVVPRGI